ncbi:MAG: ArsR/SmtB family transcription factor [Dehalococcoidia bacterium]
MWDHGVDWEGCEHVKEIASLSRDELRAADLFRALGNPARVRILRELADRRTCVTGDLVDVLPLAQSTVSQHLKVLKEAGLVRGEVDGDQCYCIDPVALDWLAGFCAGLSCACLPGSCSPEHAAGAPKACN